MGIYKITRMLMMTRMIRLVEEDEVEEEEYVIRPQRRRDWYMNGCVPSVRDRWQSEGAALVPCSRAQWHLSCYQPEVPAAALSPHTDWAPAPHVATVKRMRRMSVVAGGQTL